MTPSLTITMPDMHKGQIEVQKHSARFKVLAAGRRWRKTSLGVLSCIDVALRRGIAWWVAPSYPMASVGWRMLTKLTAQIPGCIKREVDRMIVMPTGGHLQVKSADKPDSLRGEGLDLVVLDECAFIKEAAWTEALRPALSDKEGRALFLSTPKGRNWFWRIFLKGQDPDDQEWHSWQLPTNTNPHINPHEIDAARASLPERVFLQEYMAEFVEDAGAVFRRVMDAATAEPDERPAPTDTYVMGVDWGKHQDFTVLIVINVTKKCMAWIDRFNQIDYHIQTQRLKALHKRFRCSAIVAEQNAMGEPLIEQLQRANLPVRSFVTTNDTKAQAVEALALAFETDQLEIINDPVLIGELQAFEMERLPSGKIRYQAPQGMHDDCVIALALAYSGSTMTYEGSDGVHTAPAWGGVDW